MNRTACVYTRVSTECSKNGKCRQDTARQVDDLRRFADGNNMQVLKVFEEHISGAKKLEERPVLSECIEYCIANHVDVLLVSEMSRLGRNTLTVLRALEQLHEAKVSVYVHNLGLYTLQEDKTINPIASIIVTVMSEMGRVERRLIVERLSSGKARYIANGGKLGRKEGYRKSKDEMRVEYKDVLELLRKGYSIRNVAVITKHDKATILKVRQMFIGEIEKKQK